MAGTQNIFRFALFGLLFALLGLVFISVASQAAQPKAVSVSGTVTAVDDSSITVQPADEAVVIFHLTTSTTILIDGKASKAADLTVGLIVNAVTTDGVLTAVYGRTPNTDAWGKVTAITAKSITVTDSSGAGTTFSITPSTTVVVYTKHAAVADIKLGALADVKFAVADPATAVNIEVVLPDGGHFRGTISSVSSASITIELRRDASSSFAISPTAKVTIDGKNSKVSDLKAREFADITALDGSNATDIAASSQVRPGGRRHGGGNSDPGGISG